jgi:hypothetical protein
LVVIPADDAPRATQDPLESYFTGTIVHPPEPTVDVVVDVEVLTIVVVLVNVVVTVVVDIELELELDVPDTKSYTTRRSAVLAPTAPVAHVEEVSVTEIV